MALNKKWLIFYTKSRAEKKCHEVLMKNGYKAWLPLKTVIRQWSDRKKKIKIPLFSSYIFVYEYEHNIQQILQISGIAWNLQQKGKPVFLKEEDLEIINKIISTGYSLEVIKDDYEVGDEVEVIAGPLNNTKGKVIEKYNQKYFLVLIESLEQSIKIKLSPEFLSLNKFVE